MQQLNTGQTLAFDSLTNTSSNATLSGGAGTGKTFLIEQYIDTLPTGSVRVCAPTNLAAKNYLGGTTIHKLFNMKPADPDAIVLEFTIQNFDIPPEVKTIIVDECSMVHPSTCTMIEQYCKANDIRLIGVGDSYQLPPVKCSSMNTFFDAPQDDGTGYIQLELTQPMRQQGAGNEIVKFAEQFKKHTNKFIHIKHGGVINMRAKVGEFIGEFIEQHVAGIHARILCHSNNDVRMFNNACNHLINADEDFKIGIDLMTYEAIFKPIVTGTCKELNPDTGLYEYKDIVDFVQLTNSSIVKVVNKVPRNIKYLNCKGMQKQVPGYKLTCIDDLGINYSFYAVSPKYLNTVQGHKQAFIKTFKRAKRDDEHALLEKLTERWKLGGIKGIKHVDYCYASTIHKSQGQTFDTCFPFLGGSTWWMTQPIRNGKPNDTYDLEVFNRLCYVATTRASFQNRVLQIITNVTRGKMNEDFDFVPAEKDTWNGKKLDLHYESVRDSMYPKPDTSHITSRSTDDILAMIRNRKKDGDPSNKPIKQIIAEKTELARERNGR